MSDCDCHIEITDKSQREVLIKLLVINAVMFVAELGIGWYAQSTGLIADAMDMLADATIYAIGLYAVGHSLTQKAHAALLSGWFQLVLGLLILVDIIRRVLIGSEPQSLLMIGVGAVALIANIFCLKLIEQHRHGEVHMRASWIFSKNDVIANIGVIFSGLLVWMSGSRWPDLIIGCVIALVVLNGARSIIKDARRELIISGQDGCCDNSECQTGEIILESTLTCPECGHQETETMPTDACQWFYECKMCGALLKPQQGDCCVFCSYGTVPCPPIQEGTRTCCSS